MENKTVEKLQLFKEIYDLADEFQNVEGLLNQGRWDELSSYIDNLGRKYCVESCLYNLVNSCPPRNLQDNARNCLCFLSGMLLIKWTKMCVLEREEERYNRRS